MKLVDQLPAPAARVPGRTGLDPDELYTRFVEWTETRGLALYTAQDEAIMELAAGANVILATPTGSGKSLVAIAAHFQAMARGQRSYYTAPIKALVSEKFFALCEIFGAENVGMITGDSGVNQDAPIICCTAEILANIALREGAAAELGAVIMDEFHFYSDPQRGWAWQVPLLELPQAQFLLMSATLGDVSRFEAGITELTGRPTTTVSSAERPIPLHYYYEQTPVHETLEELLATKQVPVYVVHFSQVEAIDRAQNLMSINVCTREEKDKIAELIAGFRFAAGFGKTLNRLVRHGIGVHHAGMLPEVPPAGGTARPGRAAQGHLRHRHPRRGHQRPHPHRAAHRAEQVRRRPHPAAELPRVPPDRRPRRTGRLRHRRAPWWCRPRSTSRRTSRRWPRPRPSSATTRRSSARWSRRSRRRASCPGANRPTSAWWSPPRTR